ncbi:TldD/PmbA family protein [Sesbania bispinosa]|nr:TldD/PmbA family protein [Sesbania bispinosa]
MATKQRAKLTEKLLKKQALEAKKEEEVGTNLVPIVDQGKTKRPRLIQSGPKIGDTQVFKSSETSLTEIKRILFFSTFSRRKG